MLITYDMKRFGFTLRTIRKEQSMTQKYVCSQLGMNIDTMRKIENGFVIPKIETLTMLSSLYKTDLLNVMQNCFIDPTFTHYYDIVDKIMTSYDKTEVFGAIADLIAYLDHQPISHFVTPHEAKLLKLFTRLVKDYMDGSFQTVADELKEVLQSSYKQLSRLGTEGLYLSELELRFMSIQASCYIELDQYQNAIDLYKIVIEFLNRKTDIRPYKHYLLLKCYYNLSYGYHLIDQHELALETAKLGIELAKKHKSTHVLHFLYARKAVAEWMLGMPEHVDSFQKSKHLIEISADEKESAVFKKITYEKYGVSL